ncbi:MAG TPA: hypothetical protein PLN33_09800 [Hyphomonadaceae bacterium]|nr:hypothetical protein [Hyphomonadaceae bacterium]HPN04815.1 hypothetical protein [Hyphomonadaceae bacterium]
MPIEHAHTFLVQPGKNSKEPADIDGVGVPLKGGIFKLLDGIYSNSGSECDIAFSFRMQEDGEQQNDCRDLIVQYIENPTLPNGRKIASRLYDHTDKRSGLGLLFLVYGREGRRHKLVVSRFPTDSAILADQQGGKLAVEFLERVFMKSKTSYKAAAFEDGSVNAGFWEGRAVDRQSGSDASQYWIEEFLQAEFLTTPESGTRRLAVALHNAATKSDDLLVKNEVASAVTLGGKLGPGQTSIEEFATRFNLSDETVAAIRAQLPSDNSMTERFNFIANEFNKHVGYRFVELDNGAMLSASATRFDDVFKQEEVGGASSKVKFTTIGQVTNERVASSKARARTGGEVQSPVRDDPKPTRGRS